MTSPYPVPSFIFVNLPLSHLRGEEGQEDKERLGISEGAVRSGVVLEKYSFVKVMSAWRSIVIHRRLVGVAEESSV